MKRTKFLSAAVACAMAAMMCATSAFAATSGSTKVNATVAPSYTLTVPESITLTGAKTGTGVYTGTIPVTVKGDIGEGQSVTVTSTAPTMKCSGSKNVTATFTGTAKEDLEPHGGCKQRHDGELYAVRYADARRLGRHGYILLRSDLIGSATIL